MTEPKEPNFFSDDSQYERGMGWYQNLFKEASTGDLCGESSTHYTKLPTYLKSAERLHQAYPNVKLIYMVRHPVDRLVSQYIHEWSENKIKVPINQAVDAHPELISYSLYAKQLVPYLERFGRENILPIFFEQYQSDPQSVIQEVFDFIGYKGELSIEKQAKHENKSDLRMRKSSFRDFFVESSLLKAIRRNFVPKSIREWVKSFWRMKERPKLSNEVEKKLILCFDQDLRKFSEILGREINCQNFKKQALSKEKKGALRDG